MSGDKKNFIQVVSVNIILLALPVQLVEHSSSLRNSRKGSKSDDYKIRIDIL